MNFPADVISHAVVISDELRQKQLPERPNRSDAMLNSSSLNRRTTYRSTLLETSTSEHSNLLRQFYNLYADMVSIKRMPIALDEKEKLICIKMRELADDLPERVLDMAKKGKRELFELFKPTANVPTNMWTPSPKESIVVEELPRTDASQPFTSHNATDFSLLSQNSIARRIGLQDASKYENATQASQTEHMAPSLHQQQSKVRFASDSVAEMHGTRLFDDSYDRLNSEPDAAAGSKFNDIAGNFDFMDTGIDFIDHELTQYFSNMSPDINLEDEPNMSDFLAPDVVDEPGRFTSVSDRPQRSNQNTSTDAQPATSSKDHTKTKSTNMNTSHNASSSSSGLFRLQLRTPLKVKDNRILKTPPKMARPRNVPSDECTLGGSLRDTERRSGRRISFNDFADVELPKFSGQRNSGEFSAENIPTIDFPDPNASPSDSPSQTFQLNLTQFCSREPVEESFFHLSQDLYTDQMFPDEMTPIPSATKFSDAIDEPLQDEDSFACSNASQTSRQTVAYQNPIDDTLRFDRNATSQLNSLAGMSTPEQSRDFFHLNDVSQTNRGQIASSYDPNHQASYIRKVTLAPEINPPTALQFLQYAYQNQSDDDSTTDDEQVYGVGARTVIVAVDDRKKIERKNAKQLERSLSGTDSVSAIEQPKLSTDALNDSTVNIDHVEDIILPVPAQFL